MAYTSMSDCLADLEKTGQLIRIHEEVDPHLEMAAIHLRVYAAGGPALYFEHVKGCRYPAVSNIFGTLDRSRYIFRNSLEQVRQIINLKNDPMQALKHPLKNMSSGWAAINALPKKVSPAYGKNFESTTISALPLIEHWPMDGGAFVTLPQVYTEDIDQPGIGASNLGMYRIQLTGNEYVLNEEIGLHYQLHRGIGVHQTKANRKGQPLKVSIFIGGPPAHTVAAVMPLPEGLSEMMFAGILGGRRFRYYYEDGFCISADADVVITGYVNAGENKPEGPFGDHLGYYSLKHPFPLMKVHKVYARKNAVWPFTVVGRPPQEDTSFGELIHEITGSAIPKEVPGLKEVYAVDAAGVHPLLLATGSERYTPYTPARQPAEILTIANHVLGTGQLSLAKFLFITAGEETPSVYNVEEYLHYFLQRINLERDIHFYTNTTIDTLDYSGTGLNAGSKVVFAAYGEILRPLCTEIPSILKDCMLIRNATQVLPGIIAFEGEPFSDMTRAETFMEELNEALGSSIDKLNDLPLMILCDDSTFTAASVRNFLWVTFTRSNPARDIHGIGAFYAHKHWGCRGPMIIDARIKPHHAPVLVPDATVEKQIDRLFSSGGSLHGKISGY